MLVDSLYLLEQGFMVMPISMQGKLKLPPIYKNGSSMSYEEVKEMNKLDKYTLESWLTGEKFKSKPDGIALIMGKQYNGKILTCIDIDTKVFKDKLVAEQFEQEFAANLSSADYKLYEMYMSTKERTISDGYHFFFTCDKPWPRKSNNPVEVIRKVGRSNKAVVEVRTSSYVVCAPTAGYRWDNRTIHNISYSQVLLLQTVLNRMSIPGEDWKEDENDPIVAFNNEHDIIDLLKVNHQYKMVRDSPYVTHVLRPGPTSSSYSGRIYKAVKGGEYYVEFSNNGEFKQNQGNYARWRPHRIWAFTHLRDKIHDDNAIRKALFRKGYGKMKNATSLYEMKLDLFRELVTERQIMYNSFTNMLDRITPDYPTGRALTSSDMAEVETAMGLQRASVNPAEAKILWQNEQNFVKINPVATAFRRWADGWDGEDHFSKMMDYVNFSVNTPESIKGLFKICLMQVCAQALNSEKPSAVGMQTELVLSLISLDHGVGKTRFLKGISTPFARYISENMPHGGFDDYDLKSIIATKLMVIDEESAFISKRAMMTLKALLSTTKVGIRIKYKPLHEDFPRRFVMFITGNRKHIINDTDNRRIVPMEVDFIDNEGIQANIDLYQLWGQLTKEYLDNPMVIFQRDHIDQINQHSQEYRSDTTFEDWLATNFQPMTKRS